MTKFTSQMLRAVAPHIPATQRDQIFPILLTELTAHKVNTYLRISAFLGQVLEESSEFSHWEENLSYSAQRLCQVWPNRFPNMTIASQYAHNPQALAEKVYGGRMGNNSPGDGYKYRGRGPEQTTGKNEYQEAQKLTGLDLVDNPDQLVKPEVGFKVACARWEANGMNQLADARKFKEITLKLNGGLNGYAERLTFYSRALQTLPEDLGVDSENTTNPLPDKDSPDIHIEPVIADVLLPTSIGVKVPAVVDETANVEGRIDPKDLQNVVTGHSDSIKSIAARAAMKLVSLLTVMWVSGIAAKLFIIAAGIILILIISYELNKYWPRVRSFIAKFLKSA